MAQSQNSTVDLATPATCLMGLTSHGNVMVGNKAFEYYNERNPEDYIQIPWDEVDYIAAEVCNATFSKGVLGNVCGRLLICKPSCSTT